MRKWFEVLREDVSEKLQTRILSGAEQALADRQRARSEQRRALFWWVGGFATAGVALSMGLRFKRSSVDFQDGDESLVMEIEEIEQDGVEVMSEMDLIEELELIEKWNGEV